MMRQTSSHLILCLLATIGWSFGQSAPSYLDPPQFSPGCFSGSSWRFSVGDLNNDGREDIVSSTANTFAIQLSTSSGNVGPPVMAVIPLSCMFCPMNLTQSVIGDFNRDGNKDLFFVDSSSAYHPMYAGNGLGQFHFLGTVFLPYSNPRDLCTADFDMDGFPEIVVHSVEPLPGGWNQSVLHVISTAGGACTQTMKYTTGLVLMGPTFADVTGDSLPDLVALAGVTGGGGPISFLLVRQGLGNPSSFGLTWSTTLPPVPFLYPIDTRVALVAADLDGNSVADLALNIWNDAAALQPPTISTCLNPLSGANWWTMPSPGFGSGPFHVVDVNGDGFLDLMGAQNYFTWTGGTPPNFYSGVVQHSRYSVAIGNNNGQFQSLATFQMPSTPYPPVLGVSYFAPTSVGDIDGDGDPDLLFHHSSPPWGCGLARNRSRFGSASGGGGTYAPATTSGLPVAGNSQFSIAVSGMPASAPALLALSLAVNPVPSPVLIDFSPANLILPIGSFGLSTTSPQGSSSIQLPIPNNPLLSGTVLYGQWGVADPQSGGSPVLSGGATFIIQ